jgi:RNA polymerase sigma-70 factor (ECF subfamily)
MTTPLTTADAGSSFDRLMVELRPKLHRYCARMTGTVIDGEDVLQEALANDVEAFPSAGTINDVEAWLFRIAHNAALDFLRRRARQNTIFSDEDPDMIVDPASVADNRHAVGASLRTFMRLPVAQRSSVILKDVLGYSLEEVGRMMGTTILAVKAALHRGRTRLQELAREPEDLPPLVLEEPERTRLSAYIDRFNARDFDTIRDMLTEEVRLDLINRRRVSGRSEVSGYFRHYERLQDWQLALGFVDRRPAMLVRDPRVLSSAPTYFILLEWTGSHVACIRDFRFAAYAALEAEFLPAGAAPGT